MRKSTLFVSAMLTVFLMATLFGVVSAYQQIAAQGAEAPTQVAAQPIKAKLAIAPTATLEPLVISPEQATSVAIDFLGDPNVYSVEVVNYEGAAVYLVTFSSGDLVYVSSVGEVIANTRIQPVVVVASGGNGGGGGGGGGDDSSQGNTSGGSSGEHEDDDDDDDHEDHEDHEKPEDHDD
ncbi:MAG: hypothetical protein HND47_03025 [Chloroflexi bacterium]|nr:hypothetical protein [Chloroflexota bacterium]